MSEKIKLFPQRSNVGTSGLKGHEVGAKLAEKLVKTKLWGYTPAVNSKDDIEQMALAAKREIGNDLKELEAERERLKREREEIEEMRAELLTGTAKKLGRPAKTEV